MPVLHDSFALLMFLSSCAVALQAQTLLLTTIRGTVTDSSGAFVRDAPQVEFVTNASATESLSTEASSHRDAVTVSGSTLERLPAFDQDFGCTFQSGWSLSK
jgi:hypothetical protein